MIWQDYMTFDDNLLISKRRLRGKNGVAVGHRYIAHGFKSLQGYVRRVFHLLSLGPFENGRRTATFTFTTSNSVRYHAYTVRLPVDWLIDWLIYIFRFIIYDHEIELVDGRASTYFPCGCFWFSGCSKPSPTTHRGAVWKDGAEIAPSHQVGCMHHSTQSVWGYNQIRHISIL